MQTLNNIKITADTSQAVDSANKMNMVWTEMNSAVSLVGTGFDKAAAFVGKFVAVGEKIENINKATNAMSRYGLGKGILAALRADTADVVDQMTLAQNATKLLGSGAVQSVTEMTDAFKWAISQGDKIGVNANEAVQLITNTLIGGEAEALKRFGVQMELVGTKAEKTAKVMKMIQQEIKYSDDAFAVTAAGYQEKMQAMRNAMLDTVEGFSLFRAGFNLVGDSVEWVTKKMKKSTGDIWSEINEAGQVGYNKLREDAYKTIQQIAEARAAGDETGAKFLSERLAKTVQDGTAFLTQYKDLQQKFGKGVLREDASGTMAEIQKVVDVAKAASDQIAGSDQTIAAMMEKIGTLSDAQLKRIQENALKTSEKITAAEETASRLEENRALSHQRGVAFREETLSLARKASDAETGLNRLIASGVKKLEEAHYLNKGLKGMAVEYNASLERRFLNVAKEVQEARKLTEERRKYGKILDNGLVSENKLGDLKKEYIDVLKGQLLIAQKLNDKAREKFLLEAVDKAAAIKTLEELDKKINEMGGNDEKKAVAVRDADRERLKILQERAKLMKAAGIDAPADLKKEISDLEKIVEVEGDARDRVRGRLENERAVSDEIQKQRDAKNKALDEEEEEYNKSVERAAAQEKKIVDERIAGIKLVGLEQTKTVTDLQKRLEEARGRGREGFSESLGLASTLKEISDASRGLQESMQGLSEVDQVHAKEYRQLVNDYASALVSGNQATAEALGDRMKGMRVLATDIKEIRQDAANESSRLVYAQFAAEEYQSQIRTKELEVQVALRDGSLDRARALQVEIAALQQKAEADGVAQRKMQEFAREYASLGQIANTAASAVANAAWADSEAMKKFGGDRMKFLQAEFSSSMKKMAVSETVEALKATGLALTASVIAPPTAPALWASAAAHGLAAAATGFLGGSLSVPGASSGGGSPSSASSEVDKEQTGPIQREPQQVIVNVIVGPKDGWVSNIVDAIVDEQGRGKARGGIR